MDMPSRAAVRFLRRQGAQCVAGNGLLGSPGAGDRGDQAVERVSELGRRRGPPGRRQSQNYEGVRGDRTVILRADAAYYGQQIVAAAQRRGAHFSITARKDRAVTAAISSIPNKSWTKLPGAVFDEQLEQWVSDAEVAEIPFTAFAIPRQGQSGVG